jgi:hypothetical protein
MARETGGGTGEVGNGSRSEDDGVQDSAAGTARDERRIEEKRVRLSSRDHLGGVIAARVVLSRAEHQRGGEAGCDQ